MKRLLALTLAFGLGCPRAVPVEDRLPPAPALDRGNVDEGALGEVKRPSRLTADPAQEYDVKEIIARLVDRSELDEYRPEYGPTVVTGYARMGGFALGIVANQKKHVRDP